MQNFGMSQGKIQQVLFFCSTYILFKEMKEYEDNLPFCFSYAVVRISLYFWEFLVANLIDILLEN